MIRVWLQSEVVSDFDDAEFEIADSRVLYIWKRIPSNQVGVRTPLMIYNANEWASVEPC